jgi:hypothetical protein
MYSETMFRIAFLAAICALLTIALTGRAQVLPTGDAVYAWRDSSGLKDSNTPPPWYVSGSSGPVVRVYQRNEFN